MAEPSASNEGDMVVCCVDAVVQTSQALYAVRGHLEQEADRVNIETGVTPTAAIRKYPLLYAFFRAHRQLSKLRECLLLQSDVPLQAYWQEQRDLVVVAEGRKAQASLLRAEQVAKEMYQGTLTKLDGMLDTGVPCNTKVLDLVVYCDRAVEASESALSLVMTALSHFPAFKPGGESQPRNRRPAFLPSPISRLSGPAWGREASPAAGTAAMAAPTSAGRKLTRGLSRSVSPRSCRSQAAAGFLRTEARRSARRMSPAAAAQVGAPFSSARTMTATAQARSLGLAPVTRAGNIRRQAAAAAAVEERRKPMSHPSVSGGGVGGVQATVASERYTERSSCYGGRRQDTDDGEVLGNRKLSPAERDAVSSESSVHGVVSRAQCRCHLTDACGQDASVDTGPGVASRFRGNMAMAVAEAAARNRRAAPARPSMRPSARTSADGHREGDAGADSAAGAPREAADARKTKRGGNRLTAVYEAASEGAHGDEVAQAILDEAPTSALLVSARNRVRLEEDATRVRRRGLIRRHSMGTELDADSPRRRSTNVGGLGARAARGGSSEVRDVDANEAAALRLAKQEQEDQAREDELLALRLAAREEAAHERSLSRRRPTRRGRRSSAPSSLTPGSAAAFATGGEVSEAVRALQFQDIDENDFETLLALDDAGGEGGRCCGGGKGLTEEAVDGALQPGKAIGVRLEESCAICLLDFELDDEISILPCSHVFHTACIRKWLLVRNLCPTDMQPVVAESVGH